MWKWGIAGILTSISIFIWANVFATNRVESLLVSIGTDMESVVEGEYKDYTFEYIDILNNFYNQKEKADINEVLKTVVDKRYHELADTVYDTSLKFSGSKITLTFSAKYKDLNLHKELGIENLKDLEESKYWDEVKAIVQRDFKYKIMEKVDLDWVMENKELQCYSLAEMVYVLGKESNRNVRIETNVNHAWNTSSFEDENYLIDFTAGMELYEE